MSTSDLGKREFPRIEARFHVTYATTDQLVAAYTKDLSKGGTFLCTGQFLPVNAVVQLEIELPEGGGKIPVICRVAYARDPEAASASGSPAGMGLEFLDLDGDRLAQIEAFIQSRTRGVAEHARPASVARRLGIVVADDEPILRERVAGRLREAGHVVRTAVDGFEAIGACLRNPPDVLLTDVQMPKLDGWQLLRVVRARPSLASVVVVFLTTLDGEQDRLRGYRLGVDDYVPKSCSLDELEARVARAVARAEQARHGLPERKTLRGDLEQVALGSVLQFLEMERKTGVLFVVGPRAGRVFLQGGRPLHADVDGAAPQATSRAQLFELLGWREGLFEFAVQDVPREDTLGMSCTEVLLEHARIGDEESR